MVRLPAQIVGFAKVKRMVLVQEGLVYAVWAVGFVASRPRRFLQHKRKFSFCVQPS